MASSSAIADDAVQETFIRAWRHLDSFAGRGSVEGWLIRICRNCVFGLEQRERRERALAAELPRIGTEHPVDTYDLVALLKLVPMDQREVLVLHGVLGYDYETMSKILDVPIGTIRSRLHRGRRRLTTLIEASESEAEHA